jgi:hypothetical protein
MVHGEAPFGRLETWETARSEGKSVSYFPSSSG